MPSLDGSVVRMLSALTAPDAMGFPARHRRREIAKKVTVTSLIYQVVFKMADGGLKSFAVAEGQEVTIQKVKEFLCRPEALSATVRDRSGAAIWSGVG